jgi:hypothetical protein
VSKTTKGPKITYKQRNSKKFDVENDIYKGHKSVTTGTLERLTFIELDMDLKQLHVLELSNVFLLLLQN